MALSKHSITTVIRSWCSIGAPSLRFYMALISASLFLLILYLTRNNSIQFIFTPQLWTRNLRMWDFLPQKSRQPLLTTRETRCEDFFGANTKVNGFNMTDAYWSQYDEFVAKTLEALKTHKEIEEGNSHNFIAERLVIHYFGSQPTVKTICETGFNLGHSSFNWLTASDHTILHSFDLGNHQYSKVMAEYLAIKFPRRIFVHYGNSKETIPAFIADNRDFRCDVMNVDGGHVYDVARADIWNFLKMARSTESVMMFDDYPVKWGSFGIAWEDAIKTGYVKEMFRCKSSLHDDRSFCAGTTSRYGSVVV